MQDYDSLIINLKNKYKDNPDDSIFLDLSHSEKIQLRDSGFIILKNKRYYCKSVNSNYFGLEFVNNKLASEVGIKPAKYYVAFNRSAYYLSEDLNDLDGSHTFKTASHYGIRHYTDGEDDYNSLYDIWNSLEKYFPNDISKLMQGVVKIYLYDIFTLNLDRFELNWGIRFNKDGSIDGAYILDNDVTFFGKNNAMMTAKFFEDEEKKYEVNIDAKHISEVINQNMQNLEIFIKTSSEEFYTLLLDMYEKLTPEFVKESFFRI